MSVAWQVVSWSMEVPFGSEVDDLRQLQLTKIEPSRLLVDTTVQRLRSRAANFKPIQELQIRAITVWIRFALSQEATRPKRIRKMCSFVRASSQGPVAGSRSTPYDALSPRGYVPSRLIGTGAATHAGATTTCT